ncbi:MAG: glycine oxidase ThiO [Pyrinomonadaceae bacterium]
MNSDVLIIGGGVIGLSIARDLHQKGVAKITIVDKGVCGTESSWAAAGMLGPQAEAAEGGAFFDLCCSSRDLFPALADELLDETGINIELDRTGTLYLALTDEDLEVLDERLRWQKKAGLAIEHMGAEATLRLEPNVSKDLCGSLFFPNDWQVENRKLVSALTRYAELNNIRVIENRAVKSLIVEKSRVTGAETDAGAINADKTIVTTGAWTSLIKLGAAHMPINVEPVRGQIIAFQTHDKMFRHVVYSRRGYVVPRLDNRILAGSTTEKVGFDKSTTADAAHDLHKMAAEIAPKLSDLTVADHWSGLRPFVGDGLPVIGGIAGLDGLSIATAHYRNGILLAPITAKMIAERLVGDGDDAVSEAFGAHRFCYAAVAQ